MAKIPIVGMEFLRLNFVHHLSVELDMYLDHSQPDYSLNFYCRTIASRSGDSLQNPYLILENVARVKRYVDSVKYSGPIIVISFYQLGPQMKLFSILVQRYLHLTFALIP